MKKASLTVHPDFRIGEISPRLFGAFLEPIGSMVNGSMYNPKHPSADGQGMRKDFYGALKEAVTEAVIAELSPIQERYNVLIADKDALAAMLRRNAEKASYLAQKTLRKVHKKVGLYQG